ncbi:hypothetical protein KR215_004531, partial [Drosophila sulfurigaster]
KMQKSYVIVALFVLLWSTFEAVQIDRCELVLKMHKLGVSRQDCARWCFIVKEASDFQTHVISEPNKHGVRHFGLFQFSNEYWCQDGKVYTKNHCKVSCEKLISDNIEYSIQCALRVKELSGWEPWKHLGEFHNQINIDVCFEEMDANATAT